MTFNEEKAKEIIQKFGLNPDTYKTWKSRNAIPDRYGRDNYKFKAKAVIVPADNPRSDDNGIVPGELYELFYWNKTGWSSLGKRKGRAGGTLVYTNVPKNALLNLHNHTRGKENHPFTYENGKQIFW